jgi:hairy and enhancer of split related with YRPW motif
MALKRKLSDADEDFSDYDDEDVCSVTRSEDALGGGHCLGGGPDNRKRRRGQIEKKRRDRINDSLSDLKRLVPSALEKSSSTKLEKAEILQMTVEYLRTLQSSGGGGIRDYPDHHRVAMDYHAIGFRDCAAEVSRYLITVEGLDAQDPLRLRLLAHLHTYTPRGGGASVPTNGSTAWAAAAGGYASVTMGPSHHHQHHHQYTEPKGVLDGAVSHGFPGVESSGGYGRLSGPVTATTSASSAYSHTSGYTAHHYPGFPSIGLPAAPGSYSPPQGGKPYRPWGAEMAY